MQANAGCFAPSISGDGRFVAFHSGADTLVPGDTNAQTDVFVRDVQTATIVCASVDSARSQSNQSSRFPSLSLNGQFVAFESSASNLVSGDNNGADDIFVRDLASNNTARVSVSTSGAEGNASSYQPDISGDGRFIGWHSSANNLVAGDTNTASDVFMHDLVTGITERVSIAAGGGQGSGASSNCDLSVNGRFVAFESDAPNLVAGDTNAATDVFVYDRQLGTLERVSVAGAGAQGNAASYNAAISADGRFIAFESLATNLAGTDTNGFRDVFVRDRVLGTTARASLGSGGLQSNGNSVVPAISSNGRFIAFTSFASNLVAGDTNGLEDIFLHDRVLATTTRVSVGAAGRQGNGSSEAAALSVDGQFIAFASLADDLVVGDTNNTSDVFVRDAGAQPPAVYCSAKTNSLGCVPSISAVGTPSAISPSPFLVGAQNIISHKNGLLFYGFTPTAVVFQGGTLCVGLPVLRTQVQGSGGTLSPPDCSGTFAFDFNAHIQSGADPMLVPGQDVYAQYWSRDPASPSNTNFSDAVQFTIRP